MHKSTKESKTEKNRQYSMAYEKGVPIAIGIIVILVVVMMLLAGAIALDLIPLG